MNSRYPKHRGYVLLMTLLLVALASMALAGVTRASSQRALQAVDAMQRLQQHWGELSCQETFLKQAHSIFENLDEHNERITLKWHTAVQLGDMLFEVQIADEQAKVNINTVFANHGRNRTLAMLYTLFRDVPAPPNLQLNPYVPQGKTGNQISLPPFGSLSRVFPDATPEQLVGRHHNMGYYSNDPERQPPAVTDLITCWGNGKLSYRRAKDQSFYSVCTPLLSQIEIDRMILIRRQVPALSLGQNLTRVGIDKEKFIGIDKILTEKSACYSIWITTSIDHRRSYRLSIIEGNARVGKRKVQTYTW